MTRPEAFTFEVMPVDVYRGAGTGMLVLCQEWPSIDGETYMRIAIPLRDAESLACQILRELR